MHQSTFSATRAHSLPLGLVRPVIGTTDQAGVWTVDLHEPEVRIATASVSRNRVPFVSEEEGML
jgi:hypothetical protein